MEQNVQEMSYGQFLDELDHCEKDSGAEFEVYKKLVELCEKEIGELEEDSFENLQDNGDMIREIPDFLDNYVAPMDNLARIYMERKEYEKALPLLERALPVYRTLEIYNSNFTYQRCYALEEMVKCLEQLNHKTLSILYGYELKHLKRTVLKAREQNKNNLSQ